MERASIGRIVHYVLRPEECPRSPGEHRPGIVVHIWPNEYPDAEDHDGAQLQVFTDGGNDGEPYASGIVWRTSVKHDEGAAPGTWHWPERAT